MAYLEYKNENRVQRLTVGTQSVTPLLYDRTDGLRLGASSDGNELIALFRSKHYTAILSHGRLPLYVNRCRVVVLKIVREGDRLQIEDHEYTFHEMAREVIADDSPLLQSGKVCIVDRKPFRAGDTVIYCPSCNTPYHERCWHYLKGRCANTLVCNYHAPEPAQEANP
jgi:hypothetical protein